MFEECYVLKGNPVPLARTRMGNRRMWDSQKQAKLVASLELQQQHRGRNLFKGPLHLELTFYMQMPKSEKKREKLAARYHTIKPDIDNLEKFVLDIANGVLYGDDCIVASLTSRKIYDVNPRTVIEIRRIDEKNS